MDSALYNVIGNVKIPKMARVRQKFDPSEITDPAAGIRGELSRPEIAATLKPGMNIAITAGSRGIHNHKLILKTVVDIVKEHGALLSPAWRQSGLESAPKAMMFILIRTRGRLTALS